MNKVHELAIANGCIRATVSTMSFQKVVSFYKKLGYNTDFIREGYANNSQCIFMVRDL